MNIHNPALAEQLARVRAARARMGVSTCKPVIAYQRPKDGVQAPIQAPVSPREVVKSAREWALERKRRKKAEQEQLKKLADQLALVAARRQANSQIRVIIYATAKHFDIPAKDIMADSRMPKYVVPRQVAMYLAKTLTLRSLPAIGKQFRRDHTTVLHAVRKIEGLLAKGDPVVTLAVAAIRDAFNGGDPENYWGA